MLNLRKPIAIFDLETTGVNIYEDRIIEISIIKLFQNYEKKIYSRRINPTIPISDESKLIHGISDEDVKDKPEFTKVAKEISNFLEGCDLAGFNILKFDIPILVEEFLRANVNFKIEKCKILDAQKIFHLMEKRTLKAAYKFYCNKTLENAHSSLADSKATLEVIEAQMKKYFGKNVKDNNENIICEFKNDINILHSISCPDNMIDFANRMILKNGKPIFNFGKYKGKSVKEVLQKDPSYYDWLMRSAFPLDTKKKLTKFRLELKNIEKV